MTRPADRTLTDDGVTEQTAQALRSAMARLFAGKLTRTDGRLTKQNLWVEAGVSRATMNRAHGILAEWDAHLAEHGSATSGEAKRDEEIRELRRKLAAAMGRPVSQGWLHVDGRKTHLPDPVAAPR